MKHVKLVEAIKHSVINGISKANMEYERLSKEWVSERGVESFVAASVARELKDNLLVDPGYVLLEVYMKEFFNYYAKRPQGGQGKFSSTKQRFDIVLLDDDKRAMGVVELKRSQWHGSWINDIKRVESVARRLKCQDGKEFGCFAVFIPEEEHTGKIKEAYGFIREQCSRLSCKSEIFYQRSKFIAYGIDENRWRYAIMGCVFVK